MSDKVQNKTPVVDKTKWLSIHAAKKFSQSGEDGIIAHIFSEIGFESKTFLEMGFGVPECNAWRLMDEEGFSGTFIDENRNVVRQFMAVTKGMKINRNAVKAWQSRITLETLSATMDLVSAPDEVDLLSIDLDGNDYWIWEALEMSARLVVIEYNPSPGKHRTVTIPYNPDFKWKSEYSGFYFGASLAALEILGKKKGYRLIGCDPVGVNAFFLRDDIESPFETVTAEEAFRCEQKPLQGARWRQVSKLPWTEIEEAQEEEIEEAQEEIASDEEE